MLLGILFLPPSKMPAECRPRRRRLSCPSATLLSLLAALAAPATSAPTPTPTPPPLPFLCPSFFPRTTPASVPDNPHCLSPQGPSHTWSGASHDPQTPPSPRPKLLPDRYVKGSDGLWRKVDEFTLYGSTVCEVGFLRGYPVPTLTRPLPSHAEDTQTPLWAMITG